MNSTIETLRNTIDTLTEEEAAVALAAIEKFKQQTAFLNRFKNHPEVRVPPGGLKPFPPVEPIVAEGKPAAEILIEDRR